MLLVNCIIGFVTDGTRTLRDAARGDYHHESEAIRQLRKEMFGDTYSNDAQNLRKDRLKVGRDVRISFNRIIAEHGETTD